MSFEFRSRDDGQTPWLDQYSFPGSLDRQKTSDYFFVSVLLTMFIILDRDREVIKTVVIGYVTLESIWFRFDRTLFIYDSKILCYPKKSDCIFLVNSLYLNRLPMTPLLIQKRVSSDETLHTFESFYVFCTVIVYVLGIYVEQCFKF